MDTLNDLKKEIAEANKELAQLRKKNADTQVSINNGQITLEQLGVQTDGVRADILALEGQVGSIQSEIDTKNEYLKTLTEEQRVQRAAFAEEVKTAQEELAVLKASIAEANTELEAQKESYRIQLQQAKTKFDGDMKALEDERQAAEDALAPLKEEVTALTNHIANLKVAESNAQGMTTKAEEDLATAQSHLTDLNGQVNVASRKFDELTNAINALNTSIAQDQEESDRLLAGNASLVETRDALIAEIAPMQAEKEQFTKDKMVFADKQQALIEQTQFIKAKYLAAGIPWDGE